MVFYSSPNFQERRMRGCIKVVESSNVDLTTTTTTTMRVRARPDNSDSIRSPPRQPKSVTFDRIHVRSFPVVIGDHPYCSTGCPMSLGWRYSKEENMNIDDYESKMMRTSKTTNNQPLGGGQASLRRTSKDERRQLLSSFSEWDLQKGERNVYMDRRRRRRSQIARRFMTT